MRSSLSMTVAEANSENRLSRRYHWARAVLTPLFLLAAALGMAYGIYRSVESVRGGSRPWRLLIMVAWWPYATLADVIISYINLSLPLAPVAAHGALVIAYIAGILLFGVIACPIFAYGHALAIIALAFLLVAALAGLLAVWLWLDRMYRTVDYLPRTSSITLFQISRS